MKTIAIIPARGGSKGLPNKNIRPLLGVPLIAYPVAAALASGAVDRVFVTTDSEDIAQAARAAGAEVPFLRPPTLAEDATTMEATLQQALAAFEDHCGERFDVAVFLTPTDVFRKPQWIAQAVGILRDRPEVESVFTAQTSFKNFWEPLPEGGYQRLRTYMQVYGQRQERIKNGRVIFREDTGRCCASRASVWRAGRRIGDRVEVIPTDETANDLDIHTEFDFFLCEQAMGWLKERGEL